MDDVERRIAASSERLRQVLLQYTTGEQLTLLAKAFGASATGVAMAAHKAGSAERLVQELREGIELYTQVAPNPILVAWLDAVVASLPDEG